MKNLTIFLTINIVLILISSCRKEYIGDYNENFIGAWRSEPYQDLLDSTREDFLIINDNNSKWGQYCNIDCLGCGCSQIFEGEALINKKGTELRIGNYLGYSIKLKIDNAPYVNGNNLWTCTIENRVYHKE